MKKKLGEVGRWKVPSPPPLPAFFLKRGGEGERERCEGRWGEIEERRQQEQRSPHRDPCRDKVTLVEEEDEVLVWLLFLEVALDATGARP